MHSYTVIHFINFFIDKYWMLSFQGFEIINVLFCFLNFYFQNALMGAMAWTVQEHVATVRTMASATSGMESVLPAVHRGIMEEYVKMPVVTVRWGQFVRM